MDNKVTYLLQLGPSFIISPQWSVIDNKVTYHNNYLLQLGPSLYTQFLLNGLIWSPIIQLSPILLHQCTKIPLFRYSNSEATAVLKTLRNNL